MRLLLLQLEDIKENYPYKKAKEILERFAAVGQLFIFYFVISVLLICINYLVILVVLFNTHSLFVSVEWRKTFFVVLCDCVNVLVFWSDFAVLSCTDVDVRTVVLLGK